MSTNILTKFKAIPDRRNRVKFSASQVETYRGCKRKWYLAYVCGVRSPASPSQAVGTAIHAEVEGYLETGKWPGKDKGAMTAAQASVKNLPTPGPDLLVEHEFDIPLGTLAPDGSEQSLGGFIDLAHGRALGAGKMTIVDHKSTKDYVWAKTEEELRHNVQANVYAYWGYNVAKLPGFALPPMPVWRPIYEEGVEEVDFAHHYIKSVRPFGSKLVVASMPWPKVAKNWVGITDDVAEMTELAIKGPEDPLGVEGNAASCDAYGGCYFGCGRRGIGFCKDIVAGDLLRKVRSEQETKEMEKKASNIRERLAARKLAQGGAAPTETPKAPDAKAAETPTAPAPDAKVHGSLDATEAKGVIPGDAPAREQTEEEAAALAPPEKVKKRAATKKAQKTVGAAAQAAAPTAEDMADATEAIQEKAEEVRAILATATSGQVPTTPGPTGLKLCLVDNLPIDAALFRATFGGDIVPCERWLDPIKRAVAQEFGESDYALAEFGKGKAALAAAIKAVADTMPKLISVSSFSRSADIVIDQAVAEGYVVVKATRG